MANDDKSTPTSAQVQGDGTVESTDKAPAPDSATRKQTTTQPVKVEGASKLRHLDKCPKARLEAYDAPGKDDSTVRVVRCIDCGARAKV